MKKTLPLLFILLFVFEGYGSPFSPEEKPVIIGESEAVYTLAPKNTEIRGLAFDDHSKDRPRLYSLDSGRTIFVYGLKKASDEKSARLEFLSSIPLPVNPDGSTLESPRGLALSFENGQKIFYFLNWHKSKKRTKSELWRFNADLNSAASVDLSLAPFRIGERELLSLAFENGRLLVSFDASGYKDQNLRVQRGIIELRWNSAAGDGCEFVKHLPDSGIESTRGLAFMELDGVRYLWATVGNTSIYAAEAATGRGIFHFARPRSNMESAPLWGLAFGDGSLWLPDPADGPDRVQRVNVTKNLDEPYRGPRILRHLVMSIATEPETNAENPGKVYHYYSRPYSQEQMGNQGIWPESEKFEDRSLAPNARSRIEILDPGNDASSRQCLALIEYANAPARAYSSQYEIDLWTNAYRRYVYPHRANRNAESLRGKDYLSDDPVLYDLKDRKTYDEFLSRVKTHTHKKYGVEADFGNPYWAARNVLEYIQDHYYYPSRPKRKPAAVDYNRNHYDANPANLKLELSNRDYDETQIIACSGTSVMVAGVMRYLGIPARWLGTGTEQGPNEWDANGNGLLDEDETAPCSNGHRYNQVWLGENYGWTCFDATPTLPDDLDFEPAPPLQSQWRYMNRAAAGPLRDKRIVFNIGSGLIRQLYRDFEYDEHLAVDNDCGGDQRYNLQGRFERPELWKLAQHSIKVRNLCFIKDVSLSGPKEKKELSWRRVGAWEKDPEAKLSISLQKLDPETGTAKDVAVLMSGVPYNAKGIKVNLSPYGGKQFRVMIRKEGDPETGGCSGWLDLD